LRGLCPGEFFDQKATPATIDEAIKIMQFDDKASELFAQQPAAEQRRLVQVVVEESA
jgi:hypothetical protein